MCTRIPVFTQTDPRLNSSHWSCMPLIFQCKYLIMFLCLTNISVLTCTSEALSSEQSNALVNHAYALESASSLWSRSSLWSVRHTSQYAHISICFHTGICFPTGCDVKHGTGNIPSIVRIPPWQRGEFLLGVAPGHLLYVLPDPYVYALESSLHSDRHLRADPC